MANELSNEILEKALNEEPNKDFNHYLAESTLKYKNSMDFKTRSDFYDAYYKYPLNDKMIMYEAFFGRGITGNPAGLFYYLLEDERFKDYTHVWSLERSEFRSEIVRKYRDHPNVIFVEPFTLDYSMYMASAKYIINNVTMQNYFIKKPGQVLINTWHGVTMKHLGYDTPDGNIEVDNTIRNFLMTDYLLSPAPFMTDVFRSAYKLDGLFPGKIIETGYPRIDSMYNADRRKIADELREFGVNYDPTKKMILYAPTWRGEKYGRAEVDIDAYNHFIEVVGSHIDLSEYQILFKPHQIVYRQLMQKKQLQDNFIPAVVDTNRLLGIVDILVSDYSSIFFDFLVTKRPIFFYIPDLEEYTEQRGLYMTPDDLPGPISTSLDELARLVSRVAASPSAYNDMFDHEKYDQAIKKYAPYDDGHVSERVVNAIFFGDKTHITYYKNDKIKLLFHTDSCLKNGISTAVMNLMNSLDFDKYDVTFYGIGKTDFLREYFKTIDPRVRILKRIGARVCNTETDARIDFCEANSITEEDDPDLFPRDFYLTEFARCFGDSRFDYIIDYSGFSAFWANMYMYQRDALRLIWMHNVIMSEYDRTRDGNYVFRTGLDSIFKLYRHYDACVSCSYTTMLINKKDLGGIGVEGNYMHVRNLFNAEHVRDSITGYSVADIDGKEFFVDRTDDPTAFSLIPMPEKGAKTFVNIGRHTAEKNQAGLVKAFAQLNREFPETRLYLIGEGPVSTEVKALTYRLGVSNSVIMTGNLNNPFAIMEKCDCFILPSLYEGQPMVLLEARALHLPIIVSDFSTVADSIYENGQLVIGTGVEDIYQGMKAFMEGKIPNDYELDIAEYNRQGLEEFEDVLTYVARKKEGHA